MTASGDTSVVTTLIIQEQISPGSATPLLQHFPVVLVPRVNELIAIAGQDGKFRVIEVKHSFLAGQENRQGVWVTVMRC